MPIEPSIALGYRPPQVDVPIMNPLQRAMTVMSLREMMTQNQMRQAQIAKYQEDVADAQMKRRHIQAFQALFAGGNKPTPEDIYAAGGPDGTKIVQEMLANEKERNANLLAVNGRNSTRASTILNNLDNDFVFQQQIREGAASGDLPQAVADNLLGRSIKDPATQALIRQYRDNGLTAIEQQKYYQTDLENKHTQVTNAIDEQTKRTAALVAGNAALAQSIGQVTSLPQEQQAQAWADLLAKQEKPVQSYWAGYQWNPASSPGVIALAGVKPELGTTAPLPPEVVQQQIETEQGKKMADIAAENARYAPVIQSVMAGGQRFQDLPPDTQSKIAPGLIARGYTGFGKLISDAERERLGDYDRALTVLQETRDLLNKPGTSGTIGPLHGLAVNAPVVGRFMPQTKDLQSALITQAQKLKKFITAGSLRGLTPEALDQMFPSIGDQPELAANKVSRLLDTVQTERSSYLRDLGDKVIPPGVAAGSAGAAAPQQTPAAAPKLPDAVRIQAMKAATPPNKVYVLRPDGRDGYINATDLDAALAKGYRRL